MSGLNWKQISSYPIRGITYLDFKKVDLTRNKIA